MARAGSDNSVRAHDLPVRTGVGILLLDRRGRVFIGRRSPRWSPRDQFWHMPQGGVEKGEQHEGAVTHRLDPIDRNSQGIKPQIDSLHHHSASRRVSRPKLKVPLTSFTRNLIMTLQRLHDVWLFPGRGDGLRPYRAGSIASS